MGNATAGGLRISGIGPSPAQVALDMPLLGDESNRAPVPRVVNPMQASRQMMVMKRCHPSVAMNGMYRKLRARSFWSVFFWSVFIGCIRWGFPRGEIVSARVRSANGMFRMQRFHAPGSGTPISCLLPCPNR